MRIGLFVFSLLLGIGTSLADDRPNILLVLVDDLGYSDLGCFGGEIKTPNIDRLAANGLSFMQFTNCAKCETTRTSLMSGRYPQEVKGNAITIPQNLALAGYQNLMVGKWHIGDVFGSPIEAGFDRYFGFLEGATNFFTGVGKEEESTYRLDEEPYEVPQGFYSTDSFTDWAIKYIDERDETKPFFLYLAYNAPHYPLHAHKEDVMKYRGKYKNGWEALRKERFKNMKQLGIIDRNSRLSKPEPDIRTWSSLSEEERDDMDLRMATYAAMIDRVDQQLGRVINKLKDETIFENTLILFLSDNGACPFDRTTMETLENKYMPWDPRSYYCYPKEWANACNTPFRLYKQNQNEGGIATPLIAHWPKGISVAGKRDRQRGHLFDLHATFREIAEVSYPEIYEGKTIAPARGISLVPSFRGEKRDEHPYLYQNFRNKYTAFIQGPWKLVDQQYLYNLENDRIESNDLSKKHPKKFQAMLDEFRKADEEINAGAALEKKDG